MNEAIIYNSLHLFILYSFFLEKKCKIRDYCRSSQIEQNNWFHSTRAQLFVSYHFIPCNDFLTLMILG